MNAVEIYDKFCHENNQMIFPITPLNMHTCTNQCRFFNIDLKTSICMSSRHIHTCSEFCPHLKMDESMHCGLTNRNLGPRLDYRYYDGTTTFTPRRRLAQLSSTSIKTIIATTLDDIFISPLRQMAEETRNRRRARLELITITKLARQARLHRGNWLLYYNLFMANSSRPLRFCPNKFNLANLTLHIFEFWQHLFSADIPLQRNIISFTAVCVSELSTNDTNTIFPFLPWLMKAAPSHAQMYCMCTGVTSRGMTATLMQIINTIDQNFPGYTFPLHLE